MGLYLRGCRLQSGAVAQADRGGRLMPTCPAKAFVSLSTSTTGTTTGSVCERSSVLQQPARSLPAKPRNTLRLESPGSTLTACRLASQAASRYGATLLKLGTGPSDLSVTN